MPKLRINLRELAEIDDLDLAEELDEMETRHERETREDRAREVKAKRPISPVALQRRQDDRKFGKDIARVLRERKSPKG